MGRHPGFEFPDRFALCRQLDVGVYGVDVFTARMAHERLADFLHDSGFHQPRVKRVPEVMEAERPDSRAAYGGLPCGLNEVDRPALE